MDETDLSGDSADLEALFDSIAASSGVSASPSEAVKLIPEQQQAVGEGKGSDSDDLQTLFDSVASQSAAVAQASGVLPIETTSASDVQATMVQDKVFQQVGVMTRQLHDTLTELEHGKLAQVSVAMLPDAADRLNYIANLTEQAACRVLNATDVVSPIIDELENNAGALAAKWDALFANQLSVDEFKALAEETRAFLKQGVSQKTAVTKAQLMEIVMAQDFQDLTGQVIKKVIAVAQELEAQLMGVLIETMPGERRTESVNSLLNGPVINAAGRTDVVANQQQVDDLLDSLGF